MLQRYAAATYLGRMCPGACAQETLLMQCYNRCEDKMEDKAFKDISNTQNVGLGRAGSIYNIYIYIMCMFVVTAPRAAGLLSLLQIVLCGGGGFLVGGFGGGWGGCNNVPSSAFPRRCNIASNFQDAESAALPEAP